MAKIANDEKRQDVVTININNVDLPIQRGSRTVTEIKEVGNVNPSHILLQHIDGNFVKLDQEGSVVIKGGEVFISHVPDGTGV